MLAVHTRGTFKKKKKKQESKEEKYCKSLGRPQIPQLQTGSTLQWKPRMDPDWERWFSRFSATTINIYLYK